MNFDPHVAHVVFGHLVAWFITGFVAGYIFSDVGK